MTRAAGAPGTAGDAFHLADPPSSRPLPTWVIELVAAIQQSEETHGRYYVDTFRGMQPLSECPESQFLALVPGSVRATARRWAA